LSPYDRLISRLAAPRLDRALAEGVPPSSSAALAQRAHALTAPEKRSELASTLRRIARGELEPGAFGLRIAASRAQVEVAREDLERLARRLAASGPVDPRGVARTQGLLSDGAGPLLWERSPGDLRAELRRALAALEPERQGSVQSGPLRSPASFERDESA
jgi:hypothetical protein